MNATSHRAGALSSVVAIRRPRLATLALALALGACGGSDAEQGPSSSTGSTTRAGDEAEVASVAESYYAALAERDWKAVCGTRAERDELARSGRSCEQLFKTISNARVGQVFADAEIRDVRVTGDVAHVDIVFPGERESGTGLTAVRENGRWLLEHLLGWPPRRFGRARPR